MFQNSKKSTVYTGFSITKIQILYSFLYLKQNFGVYTTIYCVYTEQVIPYIVNFGGYIVSLGGGRSILLSYGNLC